MPRREPTPWKRKSDGAWYIQLNGKQRYLSTDKATAFAKWHQIMQNEHAPGATLLARHVLSQYMLWMKAHKAPTTFASREPFLIDFRDSLPQNLRATDIKPQHVQAWVDAHPNWNSTTANTRITTVMAAWNWAMRMCIIEHNPLAKMPKPRRKVRQDYLPHNRWDELLGFCTDDHFRDLLHFALLTGARATECFRFTCEHYDTDRLILPIEDSKGHKTSRVVFLCKKARRIVDYHYLEQGGEGYLFRNKAGAPWTKDSVRQRFDRLKRKMKMPGLCMTTLRHSFAAYRLSIGQDSAKVATLMGHSDSRMLMTR